MGKKKKTLTADKDAAWKEILGKSPHELISDQWMRVDKAYELKEYLSQDHYLFKLTTPVDIQQWRVAGNYRGTLIHFEADTIVRDSVEHMDWKAHITVGALIAPRGSGSDWSLCVRVETGLNEMHLSIENAWFIEDPNVVLPVFEEVTSWLDFMR
jgi:hypothetical protein